MPARSLRLLQVDDDENDRILFARAVRKSALPIRVSAAGSGIEALRRLGNAGEPDVPDCILLDIRMPMMSGFEFLERLRAEERWRSVPVIMMSTSGESQDVERARELGAVGYYVKPTGMDELNELVADLYHRWQRAELQFQWPGAQQRLAG